MLTLRTEITFEAPLERVWATLIDYEGYVRFPKVEAVKMLARGADHPAGVGAVRELRVDGITFVEKIVELEPMRRLAYKITESRPLKLRHDLGVMELTDQGGGRTHLSWTTTFAVDLPIIGGPLTYVVRFAMQRTFRAILQFIKAELER
jgi:uncharacterized protein YndB with AHSA1/START domain